MRATANSDVYVIAEAGVNHDGDICVAEALVYAAVSAGADAIKFQTFDAESLTVKSAPKAPYQNLGTRESERQQTMLARLQLDKPEHRRLAALCEDLSIDFLSTPFDADSLNFLVNDLQLGTLKIGSGEITDGPLLLAAAKSGRRILLSTGMSTIADIEDALSVLAFGMVQQFDRAPGRSAFKDLYNSSAGRAVLKERVSLLQCTSAYPCPIEDINLRAIDTLRETFDLPTGLSDHSEGIVVPIAAAARGATIIEKHFTLDRHRPGPDHAASIEPPELTEMVSAVRAVKLAMGDGCKNLRAIEQDVARVARKSLVATKPIVKGEVLEPSHVGAKRPALGLSPMHYWDAIGTISDHDFAEDDAIILS